MPREPWQVGWCDLGEAEIGRQAERDAVRLCQRVREDDAAVVVERNEECIERGV